MRQLRRAMLIPVFACAMSVGNARAAVISVSGDECGTDPLLGLTFSLPLPLVSCSSSPDPVQGMAGLVSEAGTAGTLYGSDILSVDFLVAPTNPSFLDFLEVGEESALTMIELIPGGFRLFNPSGPGICPDGPSTCPVDVLITITDLAPEDLGTSFTVAAVNDVPEPATIALVSAGLAAVIARRGRSRRSRGRGLRL